MEQEQSKFKTLINNLTPSQRVAVVLGAVIFICILVLGVLLIPTDNNSDIVDDTVNGDVSDTDSDDEIYVNPESTPATGTDLNDMNTYLPHAVFAGSNNDMLRYYVDLGEDDSGVIYVKYSDCDSAAKTLADEYLNTIPANLLTEYTVEYTEVADDVYCSE